MLISFRHKLIFVKTVKTGSSSVQRLLAGLCDDRDIWTPVTDETGVRHIDSGNHHGSCKAHASLREIAAALGEEAVRSMRKVGVVRNPWDLAVSWYWWQARNGTGNERIDPDAGYFRLLEISETEIRADFERWLVRTSLPDNMGLISRAGRMDLDVVLRFELLRDGVAALLRELGIEHAPELPRIKTGIRRPDLPYAAYYTPASRDRVARSLRSTIDCFGYHFDESSSSSTS